MPYHIIYGISKEEAKKIKKQRIKVLEDLPPILGIDGEIYKLKKGDIVAIPKETAQLLIQRKVAVVAKSKNKSTPAKRKSNSHPSYTFNDIIKRQEQRSKRAIAMDISRTAKKVFGIDESEQFWKWMKYPNKFDIIGIDTKKQKLSDIHAIEIEKTGKYILQYLKNKDWVALPVIFNYLEKKYHYGATTIADAIKKLKRRGVIETKRTTKKYGKYGKGVMLLRRV